MWTTLNYFIGSWQGLGGGKSGVSRVDRTYEFVLNSKFVFVRSKSTHDPQEKNPQGEVHEVWGFISYDRARETLIFRQFHIEGFVNHYVLNELAEDSQTFRFITEGIENIPPGWIARETFRILSPMSSWKYLNWRAQKKNSKFIQKIVSNGYAQNRLP